MKDTKPEGIYTFYTVENSYSENGKMGMYIVKGNSERDFLVVIQMVKFHYNGRIWVTTIGGFIIKERIIILIVELSFVCVHFPYKDGVIKNMNNDIMNCMGIY